MLAITIVCVCVCMCAASMVNNVTVTLACDGYDGPVASHAHDSLRMGHAWEYGETAQTTTAMGALGETESAGDKSRWSTTDASVVRALGAPGHAAWMRRQHQGHEAQQGCGGARTAAARRCDESECGRSSTGARGAEGERERRVRGRAPTRAYHQDTMRTRSRRQRTRVGLGRGHGARRHALPERAEVCPTSTREAKRREGDDEMKEHGESDACIADELLK